MGVRYSTSHRLWVLFAAATFAGLGCAPIIMSKSGDQSVWGLGCALAFGELRGPQIEYVKILLGYAVALVLPAAGVGWAAQAAAVVLTAPRSKSVA